MNTGFDIQVEESSEEPYSRGFNANTVSSFTCCCSAASALQLATTSLPKCNLHTDCLAVSIPKPNEVALFSVFVRFDGIRPRKGASSKSSNVVSASSCNIQSHQNCCSRDPITEVVVSSQQASPEGITAKEVAAKSLHQSQIKTLASVCLLIVCMKSLEQIIAGVRCLTTTNDPKSAIVHRPSSVATEIELPTLRPCLLFC